MPLYLASCDAKDQQKARDELAVYIQNLEPAPYLFSYGSAHRDPEHLASIHIDKDRVQGKTSYQFPKEEQTEGSGMIGILPDGSGGGKSPFKSDIDGAANVTGLLRQ